MICTPNRTTCTILQCPCGFICPVDLYMEYRVYNYCKLWGPKKVARWEGLKFLEESEVPDWFMQTYSRDYGDPLGKWLMPGFITECKIPWRGGVARFNIHKVLEIIPEPLSFYECGRKLSTEEVLSLIKSPSTEDPIAVPQSLTHTISETYPQLAELKASFYDQTALASFTRFQHHDVPGFEKWYDPELIRYEAKLREELTELVSDPPKHWTRGRIAYIETALDVLEQTRQKVDITDQSTVHIPNTCYKVSKEDTRFKTFNVALPVRPEHSFDLGGCFKELAELDESLCKDGELVHLRCQNMRTGEIFCMRFRYYKSP